MPMLPPRNLPFSPNASPHTPPAKRIDDRASPSPSNAATPTKKRDTSGILPRQEETTFHRRLRTLLWDHCRACDKWEDVVSTQAAKTVASISRLSSALDDLLVKRAYKEDDDIAPILRSSKLEAENKAMDEMAIILKGLEAEKTELEECMSKIVKAASKLEGLSDAAEGLLVEATRAKGSDFTFDQEMWVTWSMDRFVGVIQLITSRHLLQTEHLHCLCRLLIDEGCAPGRAVDTSKEMERSVKDKKDEREDEGEEEEEIDEIDDIGKRKRKRRAIIRERVMERWQALALLKDTETGIDAEWFEEICEVEVGRWEER